MNLNQETHQTEMTAKMKQYSDTMQAGFRGLHQVDADGFSLEGQQLVGLMSGTSDELNKMDLLRLQAECKRQFKISPFVATALKDKIGSLTGKDFKVTSQVQGVRDIIEGLFHDYRNVLWKRLPQYVLDRFITGELYLVLSCHDDEPFVEVDMIKPDRIEGIGENDCGIIFHPRKTRMPILYSVKQDDGTHVLIPSINVAHNPDLIKDIKKHKKYKFNLTKAQGSKTKDERFAKFGGFKKFIVEWEGDLVAGRSESELRTVLQWWNLFYILKLSEIDHKRAMAAFCYVAEPADTEAWVLWCGLTPEQKKASGLFDPKAPGSTLISLPGWSVKVISPQLPDLSGNDSDLVELQVAGMNQPSDVTTGSSGGRTFAGVNASRGPWADRIIQNQDAFEKYLKFEFLEAVFFLHAELYKTIELYTYENMVTGFKGKEEIRGDVKTHIRESVKVSLPSFSAGKMADIVKAYLGVKNPPLDSHLDISKKYIANKIGIADYEQARVDSANEREKYPPIPLPTAAESANTEKELEPAF